MLNDYSLKRLIKDVLEMTYDEFKVLNAFATDSVRGDHYSDGNGIYRFSASLPIDELKRNKIDSILQELIEILSEIPVTPSRILVYENFTIEIDWSPNGFQMVRSREQYLDLVLEFIDFLSEIDIYGLEFNSGMFHDDPDSLLDNPYRKINVNPSFNSECFGHDEIEVIDFRPRN